MCCAAEVLRLPPSQRNGGPAPRGVTSRLGRGDAGSSAQHGEVNCDTHRGRSGAGYACRLTLQLRICALHASQTTKVLHLRPVFRSTYTSTRHRPLRSAWTSSPSFDCRHTVVCLQGARGAGILFDGSASPLSSDRTTRVSSQKKSARAGILRSSAVSYSSQSLRAGSFTTRTPPIEFQQAQAAPDSNSANAEHLKAAERPPWVRMLGTEFPRVPDSFSALPSPVISPAFKWTGFGELSVVPENLLSGPRLAKHQLHAGV